MFKVIQLVSSDPYEPTFSAALGCFYLSLPPQDSLPMGLVFNTWSSINVHSLIK